MTKRKLRDANTLPRFPVTGAEESKLRAFQERPKKCANQLFGRESTPQVVDPIIGRLFRISPARQWRRSEGKAEESKLETFLERLQKCPNQLFGQESSLQVVDPITGRHVRINPARQWRPPEGKADTKTLSTARENCFFCSMQTPSNLLVVERNGAIQIPGEEASFAAADHYLRDKDHEQFDTFRGMVQYLADYNRIERPWLARTFCNLAPALGRGRVVPPCLVIAIHPEFHDKHFHELPTQVVQAVLISFEFIERAARLNGLIAIPFLNGGKRPESGQSLACPHGQIYLLDYVPPLFEQIRRRRKQLGACPVCDTILQEEFINDFAIWSGNTVVAFAHPAPKHSWGLLVVPKGHPVHLNEINCLEFAEVLQRCIRALKQLNNIEPAHNIVIRCGDAVGHLHAEIIPKTETNILAGAEEATEEFIIAVSPKSVKEKLQQRMSGDLATLDERSTPRLPPLAKAPWTSTKLGTNVIGSDRRGRSSPLTPVFSTADQMGGSKEHSDLS
jgi:galactose-1-phosphate uridylyltransferase